MAAETIVPVRGTQSFVRTLSECWRRPSLTVVEVMWRWLYGIPALALLWLEASRLVRDHPVDTAALQKMSLFDPMSAAAILAQMRDALLPPAVHIAVWLVPLLACAWIIVSAIGRGIVLRRVDATLQRKTGTMMALGAVRMLAVCVAGGAWFACVRAAAAIAISRPLVQGQEPNLVLYSALVIVSTLGLFTMWSVVSWAISIAPLLAMKERLGVIGSLVAAFRSGHLRSKLVEVNLVMGIVKIALIVLAMVLSACPLPFESVATPAFMERWYAIVTVLYLIGSDFFHVVHLVSYLELRNQFRQTNGV